jgi:hypothetical protein
MTSIQDKELIHAFYFFHPWTQKEDFLWEVEQSKLKGQDLKSKEVCLMYQYVNVPYALNIARISQSCPFKLAYFCGFFI